MNWLGVLLYLAVGIAWSQGSPSKYASEDASIVHEVESIIIGPLFEDHLERIFYFNFEGKSYVKSQRKNMNYVTWDGANDGCSKVAQRLTGAGYQMAAWDGPKKIEGKLATLPMDSNNREFDWYFARALNTIGKIRHDGYSSGWVAKSESGKCQRADEPNRKVEDYDCSSKLKGYICEFFYPYLDPEGK